MALLAAIASLVVRFRRARNVERQQLKWFAYAAGFVGVLGPLAVAFWYQSVLVQVAFALAINGLPIAAGIAILKHRLYDIDIVINRTLVYGSLTASLALLYFGGVVGLQYMFRAFTGQGSSLAIVATTLAIAVLFNPLRRRLQVTIDRRFYRRNMTPSEHSKASPGSSRRDRPGGSACRTSLRRSGNLATGTRHPLAGACKEGDD